MEMYSVWILVAILSYQVADGQYPNYCKRPNRECGHRNVWNARCTIGQCKARCSKWKNCQSFFYERNKCQVKESICTNEELKPSRFGGDDFFKHSGPCSTSKYMPQVKYCTRTQGHCPGHNLRTYYTYADECKRSCDWNERCKSFFYWKNKQRCYLKTEICTDIELQPVEEEVVEKIKVEKESECSRFTPSKLNFCKYNGWCRPAYPGSHSEAVRDLTECKSHCTTYFYNWRCKSVQFDEVTKYCFIYNERTCSPDELVGPATSNFYQVVDRPEDCNTGPKYCKRDGECWEYSRYADAYSLERCQYLCSKPENWCDSVLFTGTECWSVIKPCKNSELRRGRHDYLKVPNGADCATELAKLN